jgi:hypothetical protein
MENEYDGMRKSSHSKDNRIFGFALERRMRHIPSFQGFALQ